MRCTVTQLAWKVLDFAPFRGSYVREFELSHSNLANRIIKITHAHNLHVKMLESALLQFVCEKKKANCFTTKFSQAVLRNHLGFITTSAIKCFMQRQG